ncbi:hypothetical protein T11_8974 [Trichinella zimbabwensis]|uniref:Uncharacterized protein n=1 Tax=Trichinella zimbabwensis TaxID=268475 RepID=A0A0V1G6X3_9BILA|nr:hypothetical protein T11_8974 [Trichinella zimbabwensis]
MSDGNFNLKNLFYRYYGRYLLKIYINYCNSLCYSWTFLHVI